jgi:hypothetical protein
MENIPMLPCMSKALFGVDCPLCGFQRSFWLLVEGRFTESFSMYPPLIPVILLMVLALLRHYHSRWVSSRALKYSGAVCLALVLLNYTLKLIGG